ncbi:hypothetical protein MtrunA17_Chr6g0487911 [Medicago truncatula]|uniref:Uncharacterized protein n=1 Tax=Medicago truncatula TaxID=3880 RepID=A0A396HIE9_MEDTR|nr:hypothetical protein MtrunA17_Chr6g0487911 [Medicago truncatula]
MNIQEASNDITKGGIMFPCSKASYMKANTQKDKEICDYTHKSTLVHPNMLPNALSICHVLWVFLILLKHGFLAYAPWAWWEPGRTAFSTFLVENHIFLPKLSWKLAYKYQTSHLK